MAERSWSQKAEDDAKEAIEYFIDEIVEEIIENQGAASTDIMHHNESYHHESHVDKSYSLMEAAELLEQLSDYEETDSGLWQDQDPRDAVSTMAAFTYGNAVAGEYSGLMEKVNEAIDDLSSEEDFAWELEEPEEESEEQSYEQLSKIFDEELKRIIKDVVLVAAGIKEPPPPPPPPPPPRHPKGRKEWRPPED